MKDLGYQWNDQGEFWFKENSSIINYETAVFFYKNSLQSEQKGFEKGFKKGFNEYFRLIASNSSTTKKDIDFVQACHALVWKIWGKDYLSDNDPDYWQVHCVTCGRVRDKVNSNLDSRYCQCR